MHLVMLCAHTLMYFHVRLPPSPSRSSPVCTDKGIQTGPDSKYFALYSEIKKPINNEGKELVLQVRLCL